MLRVFRFFLLSQSNQLDNFRVSNAPLPIEHQFLDESTIADR